MSTPTLPCFIVIDGIDGSGTTTQSHRLAHCLEERGHQVCVTQQPSSSSFGQLIRERLARVDNPPDPHALALMFAADRLEHLQDLVFPALKSGKVVICDRYLMSSWAYQGLQCPPDWVRAINRHAPWPDLTFYLRISHKVAQQRIFQRRQATGDSIEIFDESKTQERLENSYEAFVQNEGLEQLYPVDAETSPETVTSNILQVCVRAGM